MRLFYFSPCVCRLFKSSVPVPSHTPLPGVKREDENENISDSMRGCGGVGKTCHCEGSDNCFVYIKLRSTF